MEKIKLEDVNILIDEYDEMLVELQRDDYNLYKNSIIPFGLSILLSPLIVYVLNIFLKYNGNIYAIIFFTIFILIFVLIFLVVYNLLSIIGLNKILNQIKSENKVNYDTSVIKGILKNIGFNFEKNKISRKYFIKPLYFINYKQVNSIFEYRMYLKYEIVSKKKLLEELSKIRELKRNNKNVVIQFLKEKGIVLFIFTIITALINNYYPAIFEKLKNDGNIDSMNNIFFVHLSIFVSILVFPYIMNIFVKNGKNFQMQKLKVIENCVYYLNNFEKIEITETINKLEKLEKIYREVKISNGILSEELQAEIEENFGEIPRKYLKEYQDIYNKQEISNEEKQKKLSKLLIIMEIEKNLYKIEKVTKTLEKIEKQGEIYKEVSQITDSTISNELQAEIKENFGEIPRKYLKGYQDIYNKQRISNEEKQKKLSELLISLETEKDFYKESKIIRNSENKKIEFFEIIKNFLRKEFIKKIIKICKIIIFVLAIVGGFRLYEIAIKPLFENKEIEYILYNQTEEKEITIKANLEKIKVSKQKPKSIKLKKGKNRIERILDKKCEIPSDEIKVKNRVEIEIKNKNV